MRRKNCSLPEIIFHRTSYLLKMQVDVVLFQSAVTDNNRPSVLSIFKEFGTKNCLLDCNDWKQSQEAVFNKDKKIQRELRWGIQVIAESHKPKCPENQDSSCL